MGEAMKYAVISVNNNSQLLFDYTFEIKKYMVRMMKVMRKIMFCRHFSTNSSLDWTFFL